MGLGLHGGGLGVTKWLIKQGARVTVTDLKTKEQLKATLRELKSLPIKYVLGRHQPADFKNADLVIQNPGVPSESPFLKIANKAGVPVVTDMSLFFERCPAPIIGITGTKGKTTTTTLIGKIFQSAGKKPIVAGNIRVSPLDFLNKIKKNSSVILELSSWQLEGLAPLKISPQIALITNLSPDHLNRYRSLGDYIKAKTLIFKFQQPEDICILNRDNQASRQLAKLVPSRLFWFSKKYFTSGNGGFIKDGWLRFRSGNKTVKVIKTSAVKIPGEHNLENILAALSLALVAGVSLAAVRQAIKQFTGVSDRLELIKTVKGVSYYNDTTATAPTAAIQALKTLGGQKKNIVLLAGGADKKLEFGEFAQAIKKYAKAVVLFRGSASVKLKKELLKLNYWVMTEVGSMPAAVSAAQKLARAGEIILLSPGAASFGLFINEFDRGEQFKNIIKVLKH